MAMECLLSTVQANHCGYPPEGEDVDYEPCNVSLPRLGVRKGLSFCQICCTVGTGGVRKWAGKPRKLHRPRRWKGSFTLRRCHEISSTINASLFSNTGENIAILVDYRRSLLLRMGAQDCEFGLWGEWEERGSSAVGYHQFGAFVGAETVLSTK